MRFHGSFSACLALWHTSRTWYGETGRRTLLVPNPLQHLLSPANLPRPRPSNARRVLPIPPLLDPHPTAMTPITQVKKNQNLKSYLILIQRLVLPLRPPVRCSSRGKSRCLSSAPRAKLCLRHALRYSPLACRPSQRPFCGARGTTPQKKLTLSPTLMSTGRPLYPMRRTWTPQTPKATSLPLPCALAMEHSSLRHL